MTPKSKQASLVSSHQVVGLASLRQGQQKVVFRVRRPTHNGKTLNLQR